METQTAFSWIRNHEVQHGVYAKYDQEFFNKYSHRFVKQPSQW
jgi:hypothetical protein